MSNSYVGFQNNKFYMNGMCSVRRKRNEGMVAHTHDFVEIIYVWSGRGIHIVDDVEYPLKHGDMLFINYGNVHNARSAEAIEHTDILIKPELISESLRGSENAFSLLEVKDFSDFEHTVNKSSLRISFFGEERALIESVIRLIEREIEDNELGSGLIFRSALNVMLTLIFRKMSLPMKEEVGLSAQLLSYIRDNCSSHITLESLAEKSFYNAAYFSRIFKDFTGMTFTEYLTDCRIERAKRLIDEGDMRIEAVIDDCGYSNKTKFFRDFKRKTGLSPLKYRKSKK